MTTQITPAHVIGEDEEDVGRSYGCGLAHGIHGQHGKDEGNEEDAESFHEACIP
jgi:hypothetical protein